MKAKPKKRHKAYLSLEHLQLVLLEESCEVGKVMSKASRFGLEDHPPHKPATNREMIAQEIGDVYGVLRMIEREYCPNMYELIEKHAKEKEAKVSANFGKTFAEAFPKAKQPNK